MRSLLTFKARDLWLPPNAGRVVGYTRMPKHFPQSPDGKLWSSGDTLVTFGPASNQPPSSNYATFTTRNGHLVLSFDDTTQWAAIFAGIMPRNYASGNIIVNATWMAASATTGTIGWVVSFERDNASNHDMDSDAWSTESTITAATVPGSSGVLATTSVTVTAGSTYTDSIGPGDPFRFRIRRDVANDTATGNAQLLAVELKEA